LEVTSRCVEYSYAAREISGVRLGMMVNGIGCFNTLTVPTTFQLSVRLKIRFELVIAGIIRRKTGTAVNCWSVQFFLEVATSKSFSGIQFAYFEIPRLELTPSP